jgi:hypothetical protein
MAPASIPPVNNRLCRSGTATAAVTAVLLIAGISSDKVAVALMGAVNREII